MSCSNNAPLIVQPLTPAKQAQGAYNAELFEAFCRQSVNYSSGLLEPNPATEESLGLLREYLGTASSVNPDLISMREGLHFWVNTRNALAVYLHQKALAAKKSPDSFQFKKGLKIGGEVMTLSDMDELIATRYPQVIQAGLLGDGSTMPIPIKPLSLKTDFDVLGLE